MDFKLIDDLGYKKLQEIYDETVLSSGLVFDIYCSNGRQGHFADCGCISGSGCNIITDYSMTDCYGAVAHICGIGVSGYACYYGYCPSKTGLIR